MGNNIGSSNQNSQHNLDDPNQVSAGPHHQVDVNQQYQENAQAQIPQYEQIPSPLDGITLKDLEYKGYKQEDSAYGEIKVYKVPLPQPENQEQPHQEGEQDDLIDQFEICVKSKIFDTKEDCRDHHSELEKKTQLLHPRLARLLKTQAIINSNFCTSIYKIDMAYEYLEHNLEVEIQNRYGTDQHFEEDDIFNLIEQVMDALYYLKCSGIQHGDIQPKTVLIDREGNFKITDIQFLTSGICGYKKHLLGLETQCFLAPELLSRLRRQTILEDDEVDQERADVFSLGLIALAMASLQPVDKIYDFDTYNIRENEIHDLLEIVLQNYSPNLHFLIVNMLNQVDRRIDLETGLHLVDQMRSGQFNLEEYELKRFQTELEQSDKKLAQSISQNPNLQNSDGKPFSPREQDSPNNAKTPAAGGNTNLAQDQADPLFTNSSQGQGGPIQDFDPEKKKKSKNPLLQNNPQGNLQNPLLAHNPSQDSQHQYPQQQKSQTHLQSSQDLNKNPKAQNNQQLPYQEGGRYSNQNSEQKTDRYDAQNHSPTHPNHKQNHLSSQYQNIGHQHAGQQLPYNNQPTNLQDIDSRVRDALLRSQQVSLKFENSPLRLFRDQLLADELYVPLDPQFSNSGYTRSKNLENSGRKNQLTQSNKNFSTNNSHIYSAQKNSKKLDTHQSQSKVLQQKKWKI